MRGTIIDLLFGWLCSAQTHVYGLAASHKALSVDTLRDEDEEPRSSFLFRGWRLSLSQLPGALTLPSSVPKQF